MKFYKGILKPYQSLRNLNPSVYYLEEFCYKVLPIKVDTTRNIFVGDENVTTEGKITLNFPEFLDIAVNLDLVKSVHFNFDAFLEDPENVTPDSPIKTLLKLGKDNLIGTRMQNIDKFPEDMLRTFFGYRYTIVRDPNKLLQETQSLCCRRLAELSDDCFIWTEIEDNLGLKIKTTKPTVCKYKVEIDLELLLKWIEDSLGTSLPEAVRFLSIGKESIGINLICHPPYQGRMSFKDNLKILYPNKTVKLKTLEKITFRTNKSYVNNNNKLYEVYFIDNDTDQPLFRFNTAVNSEMFTSSLRTVNTTEVNSYMDEEVRTFEDGVIVDFNIPSSIQSFLGNHRNYKIRVVSKDLTTQNRG